MKRILFLASIVIVGTVLVCGVTLAWMVILPGISSGSSSTAKVCPPPRKLKPLPDADVLAARMKQDQDIYQKVRDEALAAYAKLNPTPRPTDDEARAALRLIAYLDVWDDYYGEGLWSQLSAHLDNLLREGNRDASWQVYSDVEVFQNAYSNKESGANIITQEMIRYGNTGYPALFKVVAYRRALSNLISAKGDTTVNLGRAADALPDLANRAVAEYTHLIEAHFRPHFLYVQGRDLMEAVQDDLGTFTALSTGFDHAFAAADPTNIAGPVLDGQFYIEEAWNARGSDWASTVTPEGWQLFAQDLARAEQTLVPLYNKAPQEVMIDNAMMTVVLGEQQPRDQMELWFQRGLKADPDDFKIYMQKRWYLLPRWYGSDDDVGAFGEECAKSDDWAAKVPMILVEAISDAGSRDPSVYVQPEVWTPLEKVYRDYLQRYPDSVHYRSQFARNAAQGGHWDVAKEQFKILGDDWDRDVFDSKDEYAQMLAQALAH